LVIAKQLSMHPDRYAHDVFQAIAARQLMRKGIEVSGGQIVRYLITDAGSRSASKRVKAAELITKTHFDVEKYVDMLILAGANILSPFGCTEETLKDRAVYGRSRQH